MYGIPRPPTTGMDGLLGGDEVSVVGGLVILGIVLVAAFCIRRFTRNHSEAGS